MALSSPRMSMDIRLIELNSFVVVLNGLFVLHLLPVDVSSIHVSFFV